MSISLHIIPFRISLARLSVRWHYNMNYVCNVGLNVMIGFVGRLDTQKGVDILLSAIPDLLQDIQFVMLGSGESEYEEWMRDTQSSFPNKFRGQVMLGFGEEEHEEWIADADPSFEESLRGRGGFSSPITHRIIAGCDILVMPSRVEPCGLISLYAMRYGTVPVVQAIGGFKDTVQNYFSIGFEDSEEGTGWAFSQLTSQSMIQALTTVLTVYRGRGDMESWYGLMKRGMKQNSSWDYTAQRYETRVLEELLKIANSF